MAIQLRTDQQIDEFVAKVLEQARHHSNVGDAIVPLADSVRVRLNLQQDDVRVYERNGQMARTCWITLSGNRWAFSYNYEAKAIDIRSGSIKGPTLFRIDDTTTVAQIHAIVSKL